MQARENLAQQAAKGAAEALKSSARAAGTSAKSRALLGTYRNDLSHPPIRMASSSAPFACRYWWFESTSLQRGVCCEPDLRGRTPSLTVRNWLSL